MVLRRSLIVGGLGVAGGLAGTVFKVGFARQLSYPLALPREPASFAPVNAIQFEPSGEPLIMDDFVLAFQGSQLVCVAVSSHRILWKITLPAPGGKLWHGRDFVALVQTTPGDPGETFLSVFRSSDGKALHSQNWQAQVVLFASAEAIWLKDAAGIYSLDPQSGRVLTTTPIKFLTTSGGSFVDVTQEWVAFSSSINVWGVRKADGAVLFAKAFKSAVSLLGSYAGKAVGELAIQGVQYFMSVDDTGATWASAFTGVSSAISYIPGLLCYQMDGDVHVQRIGDRTTWFHVPWGGGGFLGSIRMDDQGLLVCDLDEIRYYPLSRMGKAAWSTKLYRGQYASLHLNGFLVCDEQGDVYVGDRADGVLRQVPMLRSVYPHYAAGVDVFSRGDICYLFARGQLL
jgi:hypothetical protein